MRSAVFVSLAALAVAQKDMSSSAYTPPYSNPNTMYLSQTNSLGVVTGQPSTHPAVVTDLPPAATSPAGPNYPDTPVVGGGKYGNARSTGDSNGTPVGGMGMSMPTGSSMGGMGNMTPKGGAMASNSMGGTPGAGATPTASGGGMGGETPGSGSGSGSGSSTSSSSGSSSSKGAAAPALQISSGLLGAVGLVFAAFL